MGWRIVACVGLFIVPALAGCLDEAPAAADAPRLAQPTDRTPVVPAFANQTPRNASANFTDPGYSFNPDWRVGDEWNYVSNHTNYRNVRVLREEYVNDKRYLVVEEEGNRMGNPPRWRAISYLDARTHARVNYTYVTGYESYVYSPGKPDDFYLKNGTFTYNETKLERGAETVTLVVRANSFVAGSETIPLLWGKTTVGRVEHRLLKTDRDGNSFRELVVHFPVAEYGADAQYLLPTDELWRVVYVKHGNFTRGEPLRYD